MTGSKRCKKCGDMMRDVQPCNRFCDTCIKEKARQKAKLNYEKKESAAARRYFRHAGKEAG